MADSTQRDTTTTDIVATQDVNGAQTTLLSAFFGLDDALPSFANRVFCCGASEKNGMPTVFSHELDIVDAQDHELAGIVESMAASHPVDMLRWPAR